MPHIHDKIDFTVEVFIVCKNKVLLRKHDKYGIWLSVGGHIELNEDPNQAAFREVKEEVGLQIKLYDNRNFKKEEKDFKELIAPVSLNRHRINEGHEHISLIYFAISENDRVGQSEKEEGECRWLDRDSLNDPILDLRDDVKFYANMALETLGNS